MAKLTKAQARVLSLIAAQQLDGKLSVAQPKVPLVNLHLFYNYKFYEISGRSVRRLTPKGWAALKAYSEEQANGHTGDGGM